MESSKTWEVTVRMESDGVVHIDIPDESEVGLPELNFLLDVAKSMILASYYEKVRDTE